MDFLNDLFTGFIRPKKYRELLGKGKSRVVVYTIVLLLISSTLMALSLAKIYNAAQIYYKEVVPEFTFKNNELTISEPFKLELLGMIIAADCEKEFTTEDLGDNIQGFLFDKNSMIMRSTALTREISYRELTDGENITFTKQDTYLLSPTLKIFSYVFLTFTIIINIIGFFLGALIVSLIALIPNKTAKLPFGKLYMLSIFSRGFPQILSLVLGSFFGAIPPVVSIIISLIIINIALSAITPDKPDCI